MQVNIDLKLQNIKTIENTINIDKITPFKNLILHDLKVSIEKKLILPIVNMLNPLINL